MEIILVHKNKQLYCDPNFFGWNKISDYHIGTGSIEPFDTLILI